MHEMSFKTISYLQFWWPSRFVERNNLGNFSRWPYDEHLYEVILMFRPVV